MGQFGVGQSVLRVEDDRLLKGAGRYTDDIVLDGEAHAVAVRSPHANARILSIDIEEAKSAPGVLDVITGADVVAAGLGTIPFVAVAVTQTDGSPVVQPEHPLLALDHVHHVGDPVAFVVAETPMQACDAAELVFVDYEDLPAQTDLDTADAADAPQVWPEAPQNRCFHWEIGDREATDSGLESAAHTVELTLVNNRVVANTMEPRVALGTYEDGAYTLYTPTQGVHSLQRQLADVVFKVDKSQMRVVTPDVGGAFGMKLFLYAEQPLVLLAAKRTGRPVKWVAERSADAFLTDVQGRDQISRITLGLDADYRFTALKVRNKAAMGAYLSNFGAFVPTLASAKMLAGVYATPALFMEVEGFFTNTVPVDAYRGAGRPEMAYLMERVIDAAAHDLDMEPVELRRRNFITPDQMPYKTPLGAVYDSGDFDRVLRLALERADAAGIERRRQKAAARGKLRGLGHAYYVECCGAGPGEQADMRVDESGGITLYIGTQTGGQGHETAYTQIIADKLEVDPSTIKVVQGDTNLVSRGGGTGGSRSIPEGGVAVQRASIAVLDKARRIAAGVLEAATEDIEYADGRFCIVGTDRAIGFADVACAARDETRLPPGMEPGLDQIVRHKAEVQTFPNGAHVVELEVDPETGEITLENYVVVDDFGTVVNPMLLAGQIHGGVAQGIGQALLEETVYDRDTGQLVTGSFMDYCMPRAYDIPEIDFTYVEDIPCTTNPMGIKGAGEAGSIGAPPAVVNALCDALKPLGIRHIDMPATKEKVWAAIAAAKGS